MRRAAEMARAIAIQKGEGHRTGQGDSGDHRARHQFESLPAKQEGPDRGIRGLGVAEGPKAFVANAFRDGGIQATGTAITRILPPMSRFTRNNNHSAKKQTVLDKLTAFFERYFGLG
jgi:hypothetical protein